MKEINLNKDSDLCFSSYHKSGIIQTRNSGMLSLTKEASDKINKLIVELANDENNIRTN